MLPCPCSRTYRLNFIYYKANRSLSKKTFSRQKLTVLEMLIFGARGSVIPAAIFGVFALFSLWFFTSTSTGKNLHEKAYALSEPLVVMAQVPVSAIREKLDVLTLWAAKKDRVLELEAENQRLMQWYQSAQMLKAENKQLKTLLNVEHEDEHKFITARLIMDAKTPYAHTVMINSGQDHNVQKGQGVVVKAGLLGRVLESGKGTARILLLRDLNSRVPVVVEESGDRAILAGTNGDMPILEHISPYHTVKAGQKVLTSGHGGALPYGIIIGETVMDENGKISVKLYANADRASFVQVVDYGLTPSVAGGAFASGNWSTFQ